MESHTVYLALGSNISPRKQTIRNAVSLLERAFPKNFKSSRLYLTKAYQNSNQSDYYNCCVCFGTNEAPQKVLSTILGMEKELGRIRDGIKWSSRVIDIDIAGGITSDMSNLII